VPLGHDGMTEILILKTAALGDVLRTTSILPGLHARHPGCRVTWATAPGAVDLLRFNPHVAAVVAVDPADAASLAEARRRLGPARWDRVLSFDDEEALCALASSLDAASLTGAYLDASGRRAYTADAAPWFDMGLLSVHGRDEADRLKAQNRRTHPELFAAICGVEPGEPELVLPEAAVRRARAFAQRHGLGAGPPTIGLNTGAGGRWTSKQLPVERTVELARRVAEALEGRAAFLVLGGPAERERNRAIQDGLAGAGARAVDGGTDNALLDFAARVDLCGVLVASDSLAMHVAIARRVPVVAFFAPTSAAEIELYGRGEKVVSTAPDACSYRPDADNATITAPRLAEAVLRQLAGGRGP
jgi:ADP-heptose:LPS heptosyltransferase